MDGRRMFGRCRTGDCLFQNVDVHYVLPRSLYTYRIYLSNKHVIIPQTVQVHGPPRPRARHPDPSVGRDLANTLPAAGDRSDQSGRRYILAGLSTRNYSMRAVSFFEELLEVYICFLYLSIYYVTNCRY